eukprot:scaffold9458_cov76-Cyclotella_meneghiniana.AAC.6
MLPYGTLRQRESQRNNCATMVLLPQHLLQAPPSSPYTLHPTMASLRVVSTAFGAAALSHHQQITEVRTNANLS